MTRHSAELYPGQRRKEKYELFKRFRHRAIEDVFKDKFFALFDHRCFKCGMKEWSAKVIGQPPILCIDHHVPMALGGHLVPGNLVALCRRCNEAKLDQAPEHFYAAAELRRLRPLLEQQPAIFEFSFDWEAWNLDRGKYLLSLGVESSLVQELLYNPDHPDFIDIRSNTIGVSISVDDEGNVHVR
jgi:5-methylcytosine-specific restriction endonuclease McrA